MRAYLVFELRRLVRNRSMVTSTVLPLAFYLLFTWTGQRDSEGAAIVMIAVVGWSALIGVLSLGSGVTYERVDGWLRQLRATPLPPLRVVAVKGLVSSVTVLPPAVVVGVAAGLLHGVSLPPGRWLLVVTVMWLGTAPFALLGLALGFSLSRELAGPATTVVWLALAILGGLMVSPALFPAWLRTVTDLTPSFRYAELGWRALAGDPPTMAGAAILAGWTILFGLLAAGAYRRSSAVR